MAKHAAGPTESADAGRVGRKAQGRLHKAERQLAEIRDVEAKRERQLDAARERRAQLEAELADLIARAAPLAPVAADATSEPDPASGSRPPRAYCLRERTTVEIKDPTTVTLRNGRPALAGTCPSCGVRVMSTARVRT